MLSNLRLTLIAAAILASGLSVAAAAQVQSFTVDCSRGHSISDALQQGDSRKPMVLTVRGTCNESVSIVRDDVTLQGDPQSGATVNGPGTSLPTISVNSNRTVIDGLTVTGGAHGILVQGISGMLIRNCHIQNNATNGIYLRFGHARIVNNTIRYAGRHGVALEEGSLASLNNNVIQYNTVAGVHLEQSSTVGAGANTISSNGSNGIELHTNSQGQFTGNTITGNGTRPATEAGSRNGIHVRFSRATILDGNSITNNAASGVGAYVAEVEIKNTTIAGNVLTGLSATLGSSVNVIGSTISGNGATGVSANLGVTMIIEGTTIQYNNGHGIQLARASKLNLANPTNDATGNTGWGIECLDAESSVANTNLLNGTVSPTCTGF